VELKKINGDYVSDGIGGLQRLSGREEVIERVLFRLSVPKGSFPLLPQLGSELHLLGREKPMARSSAARQYVAAALREETGVSVEDVELTAAEDGVLDLRVLLQVNGEDAALTLSLGGGLS